jgi:hypothetical protein
MPTEQKITIKERYANLMGRLNPDQKMSVEERVSKMVADNYPEEYAMLAAMGEFYERKWK